MRRFLVCIAAAVALVLGLFGVAPAYASHSDATGVIQIRKDNSVVASYATTAPQRSGGCDVVVVIDRRRDFNRLFRWCGFTSEFPSVTFTVPAGESFSPFSDCSGPNPAWSVRTFVQLEADGVLATHPSPVVVRLHPVFKRNVTS
jgi:hypothetical protein